MIPVPGGPRQMLTFLRRPSSIFPFPSRCGLPSLFTTTQGASPPEDEPNSVGNTSVFALNSLLVRVILTLSKTPVSWMRLTSEEPSACGRDAPKNKPVTLL